MQPHTFNRQIRDGKIRKLRNTIRKYYDTERNIRELCVGGILEEHEAYTMLNALESAIGNVAEQQEELNLLLRSRESEGERIISLA